MSVSSSFIFSFILIIISGTISFGQTGNRIISFQTSIEGDANRLTEERSYVIQIDHQEADWISDIEIPYSKGEKLDIVEASIISRSGKVVRSLKKKEIITKSDISKGTFFEDSYVKVFNLKWNEYPYRIKYTYRKTYNEFLYVAYWFPIVYQRVPVSKATLDVVVPKDYKVQINHTGELTYRLDTLDKNQHHHWETSLTKPIQTENFSPPNRELIPTVLVKPQEFKYGIKGSFKSWKSYGNWQAELNEDLDLLTEEEKINVDRLIEGLTDKKEIIRTLYYYMQDNTRYINVAIDIGGLRPYPASYVCEKKYGDCKALTIYMKALLKHAGIEAFYTKIYAGNNPVRINKNSPGQQFNHVILNVPLEKDTIWLENTSNTLPYNYLGTFTQNRYGLMVKKNGSQLVKTPALSTSEVSEVSSYHFDIDKNGNGTVALSGQYRGVLFEDICYVNKEFKSSDQRSWIQKRLPLKNFEVEDWELSRDDRNKATAKMEVNLTVKNQLRKLGNSRALKPLPFEFPKLKTPDVRTTPVRINYPIYQTDSMVYDIDADNTFSIELPSDLKLASKYGVFEQTHHQVDNQVVIIRQFHLFSGDYPLEEYEAFYSFSKKIKEELRKAVILFNPI